MDTHEKTINRLRQISSKYMPCDDDFVNAQLGHADPIVKQWAIAAAGRVKNQKDVSTKIFNILNEDRYYDVRIYALSYLINSKQIVPIDITKELLSQAVTAKQKSILYNAIAVSSPTIESLIHLDVLIQNEPDAETRSVILTNELKIVKSGLVNSLIDKNELKAQFPELYKKSSEGRIEQEIFEMQRKNQQPELFDKELNSVGFSETPEKSMAEIEEENYLNDLAQSDNVKFVSKRTFIRDLARAKRYMNGVVACEICGINSIQFDCHHIIPLSEGGADVELNMIGVCKNCHSRFHQKQIKEISTDFYELINSKSEKIILDIKFADIKRFGVYMNHFFGDWCLKFGN